MRARRPLVVLPQSAAFIRGVTDELPNARITFDKFHVIAHANTAVDKTRRIEPRSDPSLKGMRWTLLKDAFGLKPAAGAALHDQITAPKLMRTAAWSRPAMASQACPQLSALAGHSG